MLEHPLSAHANFESVFFDGIVGPTRDDFRKKAKDHRYGVRFFTYFTRRERLTVGVT